MLFIFLQIKNFHFLAFLGKKGTFGTQWQSLIKSHFWGLKRIAYNSHEFLVLWRIFVRASKKDQNNRTGSNSPHPTHSKRTGTVWNNLLTKPWISWKSIKSILYLRLSQFPSGFKQKSNLPGTHVYTSPIEIIQENSVYSSNCITGQKVIYYIVIIHVLPREIDA